MWQHSYGSILATQLSSKHLKDIDSYILSGFAVPLPNEVQLRGVVAGDYTQVSSSGQERLPQAVNAPGTSLHPIWFYASLHDHF